mmetsp:Transcript_123009/g.193093  ORF Transcript_123009/g.193093 Transcript_123009/m.193093 type:complete len:80 (-) Transcript_123009:2-241(-)
MRSSTKASKPGGTSKDPSPQSDPFTRGEYNGSPAWTKKNDRELLFVMRVNLQTTMQQSQKEARGRHGQPELQETTKSNC